MCLFIIIIYYFFVCDNKAKGSIINLETAVYNKMLQIASISLFLLISKIIAQKCKDKTLCFVPSEFNKNVDWKSASSIYNFDADDIMGNNISLEKYRNHVLIIVNVASNCGLTDINYKQLQELYNKYNREGLRILAFPSNQFAGQEPGTSKEIRNFVKRYNVTFDIFNKVDVNGENAHPLWKWLITQKDGFITNDIKWNFTKFIIDKKGKVMERFSPSTEPLEMEETLKKYF